MDLRAPGTPLARTGPAPSAPAPAGAGDEIVWLTPEAYLQVVAAGPKAMARVLSRYVRPETRSDTSPRKPVARTPTPPRRGPTVPVAILDLDKPLPPRPAPRALLAAAPDLAPPPGPAPAPPPPATGVPRQLVEEAPPAPAEPSAPANAQPRRKPQQAFLEVLLIGFMITLAVAASYLVMHWMGFAGFLTSLGR